jgi:hypothetical protein
VGLFDSKAELFSAPGGGESTESLDPAWVPTTAAGLVVEIGNETKTSDARQLILRSPMGLET